MYEAWQDYKGLVGQIAKKLGRPGCTSSDLFNVGLTGLWQAATRFDPSNGAAFSTFAKRRIEGEMKDYIRTVFGRYSAKPRRSLDAMPEGGNLIPVRDKGLAALEAQDEIDHRTQNPVEHVRKGHKRMITWQGRTLSMSEWADEKGLSIAGMALRIREWGVVQAIKRP